MTKPSPPKKEEHKAAQNITLEEGIRDKNAHKDTLFGIRSDVMVSLFLVIVTLSVYWQVTNYEFVNYDDLIYMTENHHIQNGFTLKSLSWSFGLTHEVRTYWHPLTWLSHILDFQLYGLKSVMHHLTSLIIHMANSILLFLVFQRMTGELWKSAFVAALFALHPINVDSVAWIAERKNVLSTLFWMLTIFAYVRYSERPGPSRYLLTFFSLALGLLAKPMLVTLPFVLLILDCWPLKRLRLPEFSVISRLVVEKIPFFALSGALIYISVLSQGGAGAVVTTPARPISLRIANALVSYVSYIGKMVWPQDLAVHYPYPHIVPLWKAACAGVFLLSVSSLVFLAIKRKPYLAVGWLWFIGTLIPVIGLVQTGLWPAMSDRWAYVPLIGLFIIITWGTPKLVSQWRHKKTVLTIMATGILSIFTVATWLQARHWANSIALFDHAIQVTTNNSVAHFNLGTALANQGRTAEAIEHFSHALRIKSGNASVHKHLALALSDQGRISEAVEHFSYALRIKPDYAEAFNGLGVALGKKGQMMEAIECFSHALRIKPDYAEAHNNLGVALQNEGRLNEAIGHYYAALKINPANFYAHFNLGGCLTDLGRYKDAIRHFAAALKINPGSSEAHRARETTLSLLDGENAE